MDWQLDIPEVLTDLIESGCDVNSDKACVSFDHSAYFDYYFNSYFNSTSYDSFEDYNFTSHHMTNTGMTTLLMLMLKITFVVIKGLASRK